MALRLVQIIGPPDSKSLEGIIDKEDFVDCWSDELETGRITFSVLADVELTEKILNDIESFFGDRDDYRVVLTPVSATLPKLSIEEKKKEDSNNIAGKDKEDSRVARISKEELYEEIKQVVDTSWVYLVLIALSCVVAANGLIRDSAAMVIGAMVIAPILGPNVGLALATTLGDKALMKRSMISIIYGFSIGMILSIVMGMIFPFDASVYEISSRTSVSFADIALGLAAGVAGCLSFTRGISAAVIGVMVAVALLPPMVATGLLIGAGQFDLAFGAALLTFIYIICVNLAGVLTFFLQGIRPESFLERREGEELSRYALIIWGTLLFILSVVIYFLYF